MVHIKRLILDVLKPHQPNALRFATALADAGKDVRIKLTIPEGIEDGSILRVVGHGMPGDKPGVAPGDLHVVVYAHPRQPVPKARGRFMVC